MAGSCSGIIAREFLKLEKESVVGMVFVDVDSEFSYRTRPQGLQDAVEDVMQHLDANKVISLESR
jgi:hypothetical protein